MKINILSPERFCQVQVCEIRHKQNSADMSYVSCEKSCEQLKRARYITGIRNICFNQLNLYWKRKV